MNEILFLTLNSIFLAAIDNIFNLQLPFFNFQYDYKTMTHKKRSLNTKTWSE